MTYNLSARKMERSLGGSRPSSGSSLTQTLRTLCDETPRKLALLLVVFSMTLAGCSSVPPVEVQTAPIQVPSPPEKLVLPLPSEAEWDDVTFEAVPSGTVLQDDVITMSVTDYEKLVRNVADAARWALEAAAQLRYYRTQPDERPERAETGE